MGLTNIEVTIEKKTTGFGLHHLKHIIVTYSVNISSISNNKQPDVVLIKYIFNGNHNQLLKAPLIDKFCTCTSEINTA